MLYIHVIVHYFKEELTLFLSSTGRTDCSCEGDGCHGPQSQTDWKCLVLRGGSLRFCLKILFQSFPTVLFVIFCDHTKNFI